VEVATVFVEDFAEFALAVFTLLAIVVAFAGVDEFAARRRDRLAAWPVATDPNPRQRAGV
jgi:hypothetical protein